MLTGTWPGWTTWTGGFGSVFGECGLDETRRLHAVTKGAIGPLLHIAGLRGLKPPYAVPRDQVLRLPAPA